MPYRNRTYVAFDGDNDMLYYNLLRAWSENDNFKFKFFDAHGINTARDTSQESSIKKQLLERFDYTKIFVLLVGEHTRFLYRFVHWEIEQALRLQLPIIVVNIKDTRHIDSEFCPPILKDKLAIHISFKQKIIQKALKEWPALHEEYLREGKSGPFYYKEETYKKLGL